MSSSNLHSRLRGAWTWTSWAWRWWFCGDRGGREREASQEAAQAVQKACKQEGDWIDLEGSMPMPDVPQNIHAEVSPRAASRSHQLQSRNIREGRVCLWSLQQIIFKNRQSSNAFTSSSRTKNAIAWLSMSLLREKLLRVFTAKHSRSHSHTWEALSRKSERLTRAWSKINDFSRSATGMDAAKDFHPPEHWLSTGECENNNSRHKNLIRIIQF